MANKGQGLRNEKGQIIGSAKKEDTKDKAYCDGMTASREMLATKIAKGMIDAMPNHLTKQDKFDRMNIPALIKESQGKLALFVRDNMDKYASVIHDIVLNENVSPKTRIDAIRMIWEVSGISQQIKGVNLNNVIQVNGEMFENQYMAARNIIKERAMRNVTED